MPPTDPRFFTQDWTITLPSHPHLRFTRAHPGNHDAWLDVASHPDNNKPPGWPSQDLNWNDERKAKTTARFLEKWTGFQDKRNGFDVLVLNAADGKILGNGQAHEVRPLQGNIGIELMADARGRGVGKALFMVLLRLSNELDVSGLKVSAGTMKANVAMRRLAKGFGLVETEEVIDIPGRGVVAEVCWNDIEKEKWMDLEWVVEFTELVSV
ncbi:hypothetical protein DL95DRAFT_381692 [Leptodontidium sp. 2 PMI_412]|nr:hypothetical protein BKA61DRAFT_604950 [Leptodontidium sp. MPI-SDFR-AT-0119]KAH9221915.1 hypothetical protein DL95DRAFT_381692 [Leptodontidium sp. 2 PMI_412]